MDLVSLREEIDKIDDQLLSLFLKRIECVEKVALVKKEKNKKIFDKSREKEIILRLKQKTSKYNDEIEDFFESIFKISKNIQKNLIK